MTEFPRPPLIRRDVTRRAILGGLAAIGAAAVLPRPGRAAEAPLTKAIPKTGEKLPAIGMGSWITFSVGDDAKARAQRVRVLEAFFASGGGMIDSSPMYGSSEEVIGHALARVPHAGKLFAATKVWTPSEWHGKQQMDISENLWGLRRFDLQQVHNLLNWEAHLETLLAAKQAGRVRYVGVTTSHGRKHQELEKLMTTQPLDFVQFTYNAADREAEARLLPLAAERGLGVIVNRPFRRGALLDRLEGRPLPGFAAELGAATWAQFLLKFIVSHPAVTCAIPATSRPDHMAENMAAARGPMPDAAMRRRMAEVVNG